MATATEVKQQGEQAARSRWARGVARWGLASRGALYALIGILALKVALIGSGRAPDRDQALRTIVDEPFGRVLLAAIAVGFAGFALWQFARALLGGNLERDEDEQWWKRLGYAAYGLLYVGLFVSATLIVVGADEGGGPRKEDKATARVFELPAGRLLVAAVGLGFLVAAGFNAYRAVTRKFREKLKLIKMSPVEDRAYTVIGAVGFLARAVVFGLVGLFFLKAAYEYDPQEAVGLDGALAQVAHASYGPFLLGLTAAGLFAFGLYSFVEARYREV